MFFFFFSSRRRHTRLQGDWSSDVCSSDLIGSIVAETMRGTSSLPAARRARRTPSAAAFRFSVSCAVSRSGERRVGEEGRSRWSPYHLKKKKKKDIVRRMSYEHVDTHKHAR